MRTDLSVEVSRNDALEKTCGDSGNNSQDDILENLRSLFKAGKDFVLKHKKAFADIGQIGGAAALVAGGAALLFSGIAANLTISGIPLGIPLVAAGSILLAAGTVLQVATYIEDKGLNVGQKIRGFFERTLENLGIGTLAGTILSSACASFPLAKLIEFGSKAIVLVKILSNREQINELLKKTCDIIQKVVDTFDRIHPGNLSAKNQKTSAVAKMNQTAAVPKETTQQSEMFAVSMVPDSAV